MGESNVDTNLPDPFGPWQDLPNPTPELTAEEKTPAFFGKGVRRRFTRRERDERIRAEAFEEATEVVCRHCTLCYGKGWPTICVQCEPAIIAIRALAKEQPK